MGSALFMLIVNQIYTEKTLSYFIFMGLGIIGCFGRIYVWAHHMVDVILGLLLALPINALSVFILEYYNRSF